MKSLKQTYRSINAEVLVHAFISVAFVSACDGNSPQPNSEPTSSAGVVSAALVTVSSSASAAGASVPTGQLQGAAIAANDSPTNDTAAVDKDDKPATDKEGNKTSEASAKPQRPKNSASDTPPAGSAKPVASTTAPSPSPAKTEEKALEKPCLSQVFAFSAVKAACDRGGVPEARNLMKAWTKKAKDRGEEYKCATCHDNQRTYSNKPNATAELKKMLDVIK